MASLFRAALREYAFARILVVAKSEEYRLTQLPVAGPFSEGDLRHQLGRQPCDLLRARRIDERWRRAHQWFEPPEQIRESLFGKPGADFPYKMEVIARVCAEQQCTDVLARSLRSRGSGDDEFLLLMNLDLEPEAAAPFFIR